jgi:hypothetical protein
MEKEIYHKEAMECTFPCSASRITAVVRKAGCDTGSCAACSCGTSCDTGTDRSYPCNATATLRDTRATSGDTGPGTATCSGIARGTFLPDVRAAIETGHHSLCNIPCSTILPQFEHSASFTHPSSTPRQDRGKPDHNGSLVMQGCTLLLGWLSREELSRSMYVGEYYEYTHRVKTFSSIPTAPSPYGNFWHVE